METYGRAERQRSRAAKATRTPQAHPPRPLAPAAPFRSTHRGLAAPNHEPVPGSSSNSRRPRPAEVHPDAEHRDRLHVRPDRQRTARAVPRRVRARRRPLERPGVRTRQHAARWRGIHLRRRRAGGRARPGRHPRDDRAHRLDGPLHRRRPPAGPPARRAAPRHPRPRPPRPARRAPPRRGPRHPRRHRRPARPRLVDLARAAAVRDPRRRRAGRL